MKNRSENDNGCDLMWLSHVIVLMYWFTLWNPRHSTCDWTFRRITLSNVNFVLYFMQKYIHWVIRLHHISITCKSIWKMCLFKRHYSKIVVTEHSINYIWSKSAMDLNDDNRLVVEDANDRKRHGEKSKSPEWIHVKHNSYDIW